MNRALRPKPSVAVTPAMVSQLTSLATLGVDERRFLEEVIPRCSGVARVGRLRVVPVDEALRALAGLAPEKAPREPVEAPGDEADPDGEGEFASVDDVLGRLGRKAGAR